MAPASSSPQAAPGHFVNGDTPVTDVLISVEGLRGQARSAALAVGENARGARCLGSLDERLRRGAVDLASLADLQGDVVTIEVSPGAAKGCVRVAFRPPLGARLAAQAGLDDSLDHTLSLSAQKRIPKQEGRPSLPPLHLGIGGLASLGRDAVTGVLRASPLPGPGAAPALTPTFEFATTVTNCTQKFGPFQKSQLGAVTLAEASGRHSVRVEATSRELLPDEDASQAVWRSPLQTTKMSVGYHFFDDMREAGIVQGSPVGELRKASVQMAGGLGDVEILRAEGVWLRTWPVHTGTCTVSTAVGLAVPLGWKGITPWEDRFFLGGSFGGLTERLPGFMSHGVGPTDARRDPNAIELGADEEKPKKKQWRFDQTYRDNTQLKQNVAESGQISSTKLVDHIGGNARATTTATLQLPLPVPSFGGLQLHGLMIGAVGSLVDTVRPSLIRDFASQARASVAVGVGTPLPCGGFLGLMVAQPLLSQPNDLQRKLQLSLSFGSVL